MISPVATVALVAGLFIFTPTVCLWLDGRAARQERRREREDRRLPDELR